MKLGGLRHPSFRYRYRSAEATLIVPTLGGVGGFAKELPPHFPQFAQFPIKLGNLDVGVSMNRFAVVDNHGIDNQSGVGVVVLGIAGVEGVGDSSHHGGNPFRLVMYIL